MVHNDLGVAAVTTRVMLDSLKIARTYVKETEDSSQLFLACTYAKIAEDALKEALDGY